MTLKTCVRCNATKSIEDFEFTGTRLDPQLRARCRACMAAYRKQYYESRKNVGRRDAAKERRAKYTLDLAQSNDKIKRRKACERLARMPWGNRSDVHALYLLGKRLRALGLRVQVDHLYPMRGYLVCGLTVPGNLQLVMEAENRRKGVSVTEPLPGMPPVHADVVAALAIKFGIDADGIPQEPMGLLRIIEACSK